MPARAALRASDADREHVAERLRKAAVEGRLDTDELEERLETALSARTYGQLEPLLRDLPARRRRSSQRSRALALGGTALLATLALTAVVLAAIAVLFIATGVFAGWLLWILAGWFFFGHRRRALRYHRARSRRSLHGCGAWPARRYWA
jgi:DUF1707 SHOCT-like domain